MNILIASSELHPFSGTGGLSDMVAGLGKALAARGHNVIFVTPLYKSVTNQLPDRHRPAFSLQVEMGRGYETVQVFELRSNNAPTTCFIAHPVFDRPGLYQWNGTDYPDNWYRFLLFSKAVVAMLRNHAMRPDILHLNDWHTAMAALLIHHIRTHHHWPHTPKVCFTIHNLAYQGIFSSDIYHFTNLPWSYFTMDGVEFYGQTNFMKAGIGFADMVTTVSPRYAREIMTPEFGAGLDGFVRKHAAKLVGILNGIDTAEWDPATDPHLPCHFHVDNLQGKSECKAALQKELGLPVNPDTPLFCTITRLVEQKGIDILIPAMEHALTEPDELQFVVLANGNTEYESRLAALAQKFPHRMSLHIGFNRALSHRVEAGADFFVLPSRYEPCGLNQMYSQRYGTIPVVRRVGGLDDTVIDIADEPIRGTGIKFEEYSATAVMHAIKRALNLYRDKSALTQYRRNAMLQDFSWTRAAAAYEALFLRHLRPQTTTQPNNHVCPSPASFP